MNRKAVSHVPILGKMNGAVGNFNAHVIAYPEVDWQRVSLSFIRSLGLQCSAFTTQIEPHDWISELSHALSRFNTVLLGLDRDMWGYVSRGYFRFVYLSDRHIACCIHLQLCRANIVCFQWSFHVTSAICVNSLAGVIFALHFISLQLYQPKHK